MEGNSEQARKNNNPGNLRDPDTGKFRQFKTKEDGEAALKRQLESWKSRFPDWTIHDLNGRYAPDKSMGGDNPEGTVEGRDKYLVNKIQ